jgi:hypothetical protein
VIQSPSPAERMRLHRKRRREGVCSIRIELTATQIDVLVQKGILRQEDRGNHEAVQWALFDLIYLALDDTM